VAEDDILRADAGRVARDPGQENDMCGKGDFGDAPGLHHRREKELR